MGFLCLNESSADLALKPHMDFVLKLSLNDKKIILCMQSIEYNWAHVHRHAGEFLSSDISQHMVFLFNISGSLHFSDYVVELPQDWVIWSTFNDTTITKEFSCMNTWFLLSKKIPFFPFIYSAKEKQARNCGNHNILAKRLLLY